MKKPNGFGCVYKMSGKRRRPYRAIITVGKDADGKQIRKTLGYYETKKDALAALGAYHSAPYSLDRLRFEDVYQKWSDERFPALSDSTVRGYTNAYKHSQYLHKKVFSELRTLDLENSIKASGVTVPVQHSMKNLYVQLYSYALRYDMAQRNYAKDIMLESIKETSKRNNFTNEEINALWEYVENPTPQPYLETAKMVLVGIYSGWRPRELCTYTLEEDLMVGGVKTKSGKDRIVPVHPFIKDFVDREPTTYSRYQANFQRLMIKLDFNHTPHDTRRTFASLAAEFQMDENIRKLIMGHSNPDLTERVYTTHTVDALKREIAKIGRI